VRLRVAAHILQPGRELDTEDSVKAYLQENNVNDILEVRAPTLNPRCRFFSGNPAAQCAIAYAGAPQC